MTHDGPSPEPPCPNKPGAFRDLVREHEAMVHATAKRVTGSSALAEDVAQETFLALARQPLGTLGSVRAWLRRVAGRKALNAVRSETRRRRVEEAAILASASSDQSHSTDIEQLIRQTLEELPPHLKEPLVEHYLEGQTQERMASRRAVSQPTISRQIENSVRELKRRLRAKGILCGAGFAAMWSSQSASAAPASLGTLGQLVAGGAHCNTSASTLTSTLLCMNITKATLALVAASALIAVPVLLQDRQDTPGKPAVSKSSPKLPSTAGFTPASSAKARKTSKVASAEKHYRPEPVPESVRLKVDALVQRTKGMSENELLRDPEYWKLFEKFGELLTGPKGDIDPEGRIMQAMMGLMATKGIDPQNPGVKNGMPVMTMHPGPLDEPRGRAWAEAVLSEDPKRAEDWLVNLVDGAAFEFAFDPSKQSSGGVTFQTAPKEPRKDEE